MKHLYFFLLLLPAIGTAQTVHNVEVGGSTLSSTQPYYSPQFLTIEVNDIVRWTNASGTHNVNGSLTLFPANPEGFNSGTAANGSWTFEHTFTIPGTYNYHCTQFGHSATQFGTITVVSGLGVNDPDPSTRLVLFPLPATNTLSAELSGLDARTVEVWSTEGRRVITRSLNGSGRMDLSVAALSPGAYVLRLLNSDGRAISRPFVKE